MFTLIENGDVYSPKALGKTSISLSSFQGSKNQIIKIGEIRGRELARSGLDLQVIDARNCCIFPGFIDPHEHLIGGSGEQGFFTQTPQISLDELLQAGITTVVGCLGTDTLTKTMPALLARVKALNEEGITAYLYSGGYNVPPVTLTDSLLKDILYINEVIGAGEIAISDIRSCHPNFDDLAKLASEAYVAGTLSGKAGITHFHVGPGKNRLEPLRKLLTDYEILPTCIYPTHIERNEDLMMEAIELSRQGVTVDIDTIEKDLFKWVKFYLNNDGNFDNLTVSSDAGISSPLTLYNQFRDVAHSELISLERTLALFTTNTARILKLHSKGRITEGAAADLLIAEKDSLNIRDVLADGKIKVKNGSLLVHEKYLEKSNRRITLYGKKCE